MTAPSRTITAELHALGRLSWDALRHHLGDDTCAWADLGGFHVGPVPVEMPVATHLWAWRRHRWIRVRFDEDSVIAAALDASTPSAEGVRVLVDQVRTWPDGENRIAEQSPGVLNREYVFLRPTGSDPAITFAGEPGSLPDTSR